MDRVERALAEFNARRNSSESSRIDALLDIEQLSDARVMPFLLQLAINIHETFGRSARRLLSTWNLQ
jgi:hypothetical protein